MDAVILEVTRSHSVALCGIYVYIFFCPLYMKYNLWQHATFANMQDNIMLAYGR